MDGKATTQTHRPSKPPYPSSWIDRLVDWVAGLPGPSWPYYLVLWLILLLAANGLGWLDGSLPVGQIDPLSIAAADFVYLAVLLHYLKQAAGSALDRFRPVLDADEKEVARLRYELTTLPRRDALWATGAVLALAALNLALNPRAPTRVPGASSSSRIFDSLVLLLNLAFLAPLVLQTLRQLALVNRIHAAIPRVDLFQAHPLYAFSGLTGRIALGYILLADLSLTFLLIFSGEESLDPVAVAIMALMIPLALVTFALPLLGMHRRMVEEKERLQAKAGRRLAATLAELHRRVDDLELGDIETLKDALSALQAELDLLAGLSTWPWQAGMIRALASALLLPVGVWILERILERFVVF